MTDRLKKYTAEDLRLLRISSQEADPLSERVLRCPLCKFKLQTVFSDATGHMRIKCPKCKHDFILNIAYFRTMKPPRLK